MIFAMVHSLSIFAILLITHQFAVSKEEMNPNFLGLDNMFQTWCGQSATEAHLSLTTQKNNKTCTFNIMNTDYLQSQIFNWNVHRYLLINMASSNRKEWCLCHISIYICLKLNLSMTPRYK